VVLGPGVFTREDSLLPDGSVQVALAFRFTADRMSADEVNAFRRALAEVSAHPVAPVAFEAEVSAAVDHGDLRRAVERSRQLIARQPRNTMHHVRLARTLLQAGLGELAHEEARRAVQLAPKSAEAWAQLGELLSHDLRGLQYPACTPQRSMTRRS